MELDLQDMQVSVFLVINGENLNTIINLMVGKVDGM